MGPWRFQTSLFILWIPPFSARKVSITPAALSHCSPCQISCWCGVQVVSPQLSCSLSDLGKENLPGSSSICFKNLKFCNISLSFFKLSIPNDFSIFISLGKRGWIGPESHQGLNKCIQNLKEEGMRLTLCESEALGRMAHTMAKVISMTWTHSKIITPSVGAGTDTWSTVWISTHMPFSKQLKY